MGKGIHLSDFKVKKVLLSFHPLAWTKVCADQIKALETNHARFEDSTLVALGMSVDTVPSKKAGQRSLGSGKQGCFDFWPHGEVAQSYGIFRDKDGVSERANIIVDEKGQVIFSGLSDIAIA